MTYNRALSPAFAELIKLKGPLRWFYEYVKSHEELDFLIGKNDTGMDIRLPEIVQDHFYPAIFKEYV